MSDNSSRPSAAQLRSLSGGPEWDNDDDPIALLERVVQRISAAALLLETTPGARPALDELDTVLDAIAATMLSLPDTPRLGMMPPPAAADDDVPVALIRFHLQSGATDTNRAWTALTGLERDASLGAGWLSAIAPGQRMEAAGLVNRVLFGGGAATAEWPLAASDQDRWAAASISGNQPAHCSAALLDLTARKLHEDELARRATHDPLTGVANRGLLLDRTAHALKRLARRPGGCAVLFIDLDQFKEINDRFGHRDGDAVLVELARRLSTVLRPTDTLARVGGDEFVVLCEDLSTRDDAMSVAQRVSAAVREPIHLGGGTHAITASIGVAFADSSDASVEALLHRADRAMYRAKRRSGNGPDADTAGTVLLAAPPTEPAGPVEGLHAAIRHLRSASGALDEGAAGDDEGGTDVGDNIHRALAVLQGVVRQLV